MPDYCVAQFEDGSPLHPGIVGLNIEKARIKYIKSFLELEGNQATEGNIGFFRGNVRIKFRSHILDKTEHVALVLFVLFYIFLLTLS